MLAGLLLPGAASAGDWPCWRGPRHDDHSDESSGWKKGVPWPGGKPAWSARVGEGVTSPLVVKGRLYVLGWAGGRDHLSCLDATTGKERWTTSYPCPRHARFHLGDEGFYAGPSSTPAFDVATGLLYTLSSDGDLHCWDSGKKGAKKWGLNLYVRYRAGRRPKIGRGGAQRDFGYTTAPLVVGDAVLVEVGGKEGNVMAFDKRTGKRRWVSECKDLAGHTGGLAPLTVEGVPCVAVLTLTNLVVLRLDRGREGRTVATHPWATEFGNNIATPAVDGQHVVVTSGYNIQAICKLAISLRGARVVWQKRLYSKACSPVIYKGHVYWAWQKLRCLDLKSGALKWEGGYFGDPGSCVATADGRLIVWGQNGRLALVETAQRSPGEYKELARLERVFASHAWPHVLLSGGRLYCKDRRGNLKCFALRR
jgi:outer membrane protein assembly factor BamB